MVVAGLWDLDEAAICALPPSTRSSKVRMTSSARWPHSKWVPAGDLPGSRSLGLRGREGDGKEAQPSPRTSGEIEHAAIRGIGSRR